MLQCEACVTLTRHPDGYVRRCSLCPAGSDAPAIVAWLIAARGDWKRIFPANAVDVELACWRIPIVPELRVVAGLARDVMPHGQSFPESSSAAATQEPKKTAAPACRMLERFFL